MGLTKMDRLLKAMQKASFSNMMDLLYLNKKGELKIYTVEVYDYDDIGFFGYDLAAEHIKRFNYSNVNRFEVKEKMIPRFIKKEQ